MNTEREKRKIFFRFIALSKMNHFRLFAGAERIELSYSVLETEDLPLIDAP